MTDPLSFSDLKLFARSPAHYREHVRNRKAPTAPMKLGSLTHAAVLGFRPGYKDIVFEGKRAGNKWSDFKAEYSDRDIFTVAEYDTAQRIAEAVKRDPVAGPLLESSRHEVPATWTFAGMPCKTRGVDMLGADWIGDLKTTADASPYRFGRDCLRRQYHAQLAWYHDAAISLGVTPERHVIIGVESAPPHCVTVFELTPRALEAGRATCRAWVEHLRVCIESDTWPGYTQSIQPLDVADDEPMDLIIDGETVTA